jgi:ABC-type dipeptide/oligopeptide/nickel transport system permease component
LLKFVIRRILQLVPVLFGVVTVTFLIMYIIPGDPVLSLVGERYDDETIDRIREELGLNKPLPLQYIGYVGRVARLDFGRSFVTGRPVIESIKEYFPRTLLLAFSSMLIAVVAGIVIGAISSQARQREDELLKHVSKKKREEILKTRAKAQKAQEKANKDLMKFAWWFLGIIVALMVLFILFLMSL